MKVYIAGPMTGIEDLNYPAFIEAEEALRKVGYDVLNPARVDVIHQSDDPHCVCHDDHGYKHSWEWYMEKCIPMVRAADGVAVLPGWQHSRGAQIEVQIATIEALIPVAAVPTWVARHKMLQAGRFE